MTDNSAKILKSINPVRIILPVAIGIAVTAYLMYREYEPGSLNLLTFSIQTAFWLFVSIFLMATRDFGYMLRLRILSEKSLSWKKVFNIIMLWEFTSAITPSAVGGTSVAVFFINKEGIRLGKSTAIVLLTSFLDELYFILSFPALIIIAGGLTLFSISPEATALTWYKNPFILFALLGYSIKLIYILALSYGLFVNPRGLKLLLLWIFKLSFIRKWRPQANESGSELIQASNEFKHWPIKKWIRAFMATAVSWTARYWLVNTIIIAFFGLRILDPEGHFLVFGKQLVIWIMMLVSPTPGGSGFAEYAFHGFLGYLIPAGTGIAMAFIWRLISYYSYLIIGVFILPKWIKKHITKR